MNYEVCHVMIVMSVVISVYVIISVITNRVTQGYSCLRWCRTGILISTVPLEYFYEILSSSLFLVSTWQEWVGRRWI